MATAKRVPWGEGMKVAGAIADDVGPALPYVAVAFKVTKIIIEYAQAAKANKDSCMLLAKRAVSIKNMLVEYFGPDGEKLVNKRHDLTHKSLLECLSDLESGLQSACSLVKKFSSAEKAHEKVLRALRAKNYLGEFQACGDRLTELESQLSNIITSKIAHDQEQNQQELLRKLEQNHLEMMQARDADRVRDRSMLERELRALPERIAVLQMHSISADVPTTCVGAGIAGSGDSMQPQLIEPWFIDVADVEKEEHVKGKKRKFVILGTGGFGTVFRGTCRGETVAVKQVNSSGDKAMREFKNELGMMWRVSHENIIRTHGGFYPLDDVDDHEDEMPLIVLEYAPKGSLEKYMFADRKMNLLPKATLLIIFRGVLDGLKYLHASKVLHRDIKPQNILLMEDWTPKISDFGLATVKNTCSFANTKLGTRGYMAPEIIRGDQYNRSCDVWSYGVMLFEMLLGEAMFESEFSEYQILKILEDPKRGVPWDRLNKSEYAKQWPAWVVEIASACLQTTPKKRPTVPDIWLEFYGSMGAEGATAAAKSQTAQYAASTSGLSTAKFDALTGKLSHVTVSGGPVGPSSSTGGSAAGPSGSRPVQAPELSADDKLRYAEEWEVAGNMAYAYEYFKLAAEAGAAEGQFRLGKILLDGSHGMSQHLEHGAGWVRAAAEKGRTDAMIEYGRCHHSGRGVPQNLSLAKEWYAKAAKLGSPAGSEWLKAVETEEQTALRRQQNEAAKRRFEEDKKKAERDRQALEHAAAVRRAAAEEHERLEKEARDLAARREAEAAAARKREEEAAAAEQARREKEARELAARRAAAAEQARREKEARELAAQRAAAAAEQARRDAADWQRRGQAAEDEKNFAEALIWYRKAAQVENAFSQGRVGYFYHKALGGLPQDKRSAVEWYRKAAAQGDAQAQCNLGTCYENGEGGLPQDTRAAVEWWRKAADQASVTAQCGLGYCHEKGLGGLQQDKRAAVEWFRKAAAQGLAEAQCILGYYYSSGEGGLPRDSRVAVEWWHKAADQGLAEAQCSLGYCYSSGEGGLPQDARVAVEWWRTAADQGLAEAQYILGYCYENGEGGLMQDKRAAVEWWRKAAQQGQANAQCALACCYENGSGGLPQDTLAAVQWLRKAAEQGNARAQKALKRLRY